MPQRGFDSSIWSKNREFRRLSTTSRYLYIYLWTNDHCNPAGFYQITLESISFESSIPEQELQDILPTLTPLVQWIPDHEIIWVRDFIKEQTNSPKFTAAAGKVLATMFKDDVSLEDHISDVVAYNLLRHRVEIPYQYYIDKILILTRAADTKANADARANAEGKGGIEGGKTTSEEKVLAASVVPSTLARSDILQKFETLMGRPIIQSEAVRLDYLETEFTAEWLAAAIDEADSSGGRRLGYVEAILERWRVDGFKSSLRARALGAVRSKGDRRAKKERSKQEMWDELYHKKLSMALGARENELGRELTKDETSAISNEVRADMPGLATVSEFLLGKYGHMVHY